MQIRLSISLALGAIIIPTIALFAANPATAQSRDVYNDRDPHYYCDGLARDRASRSANDNAAGNIVGGAAKGAAGGAIIGAITGGAGKGAGIGAVVGGLLGGGRTASNKDQIYRSEYDACMRRHER